jgi:hypothetical protein
VIANSDREFKERLFTMFDMACEMTRVLAPKYTNTRPHNVCIRELTDKSIYEDLYEDLLD